MKRHRWFGVAVLWACIPFAQDAPAQDYTRWNLPEGAVARLGKGRIGDGDRALAFSPDGGRLAVAASTGIWVYDARTGAFCSFQYSGAARRPPSSRGRWKEREISGKRPGIHGPDGNST